MFHYINIELRGQNRIEQNRVIDQKIFEVVLCFLTSADHTESVDRCIPEVVEPLLIEHSLFLFQVQVLFLTLIPGVQKLSQTRRNLKWDGMGFEIEIGLSLTTKTNNFQVGETDELK